MSDTSPVLSLPLIQPAQAQKHVTHNEALVQLEPLVMPAAISRALSVPPVDPAPGDRYLVGAGATGAWSGQGGALATWDGTAWRLAAPAPGWQVYVLDEGHALVHDGTGWGPLRLDPDNRAGLGIGTGHDAVNRLAVASEAALFTHAGAGHQIKVNKAASGDTASLLFQTGWSGRAEIGLAGNDDLSLKTSADGSTWVQALQVEAASGITAAAGLRSTTIAIADGVSASVAPPAETGLALVCAQDAGGAHGGVFAFGTGGAPHLAGWIVAAQTEALGTTALTGTIATAGHTGIAAATGALWLENRSGTLRTYSLTFLV